MCYMESVGVRQLRQNASELLERVQTGEQIQITNHGRAVARLVPITSSATTSYDDLVMQGMLRPGRGDPRDVVPVTPPDGSLPTEVLLALDRDEVR